MSLTPLQLQQEVEILTGRRNPKGQRAVRFDDLQRSLLQPQAQITQLQRQFQSAGLPTIRDKIQSVRAAVQKNITFVDEQVQSARDDLQALIDAQGVTIIDIQDEVAANEAAIISEAAARATEDSALAGQITTINSQVNLNIANLTAEQVARVNGDNAIAAEIVSLETDLNGAVANAQQALNTVSTLEGYAAATYTLRLKAGTAGAQVEIVAADDPLSGPVSAVRIDADDILLDGSVLAQHIDVNTLAANIAFIQQLTANSAFISNLQVGNGSIQTLNLAGNAATAAAFSQGPSRTGAGMASPQSAGGFSISVPGSTIAKVLVVASFAQGYTSGARQWGFRIRQVFKGSTTTILQRTGMNAISDYPTVAILVNVANVSGVSAARNVSFLCDWYGQDSTIEMQQSNFSGFAGWR